MFWNSAEGTEEEQQAISERTPSGSLGSQVVQDSHPVSLAEVLQVSPSLLIRFSLFSHSTLLIILRAKFGSTASHRSIRVLLKPLATLSSFPSAHTCIGLSLSPSRPSLYTGRVLTQNLLLSAHAVLFFSRGEIWKGTGTDRQIHTF